MSLQVTVGDWESQSADAQTVRYDVFVVEQKVPLDMEWDEMDSLCMHAVAYVDNGVAIGTGRLLPDGHIGRMAVVKAERGKRVGSAILEALIAEARKRGDSAVMLNAQTHAEPFYQRFGFVRVGEVFMEAGIPHIHMRRAIT